jgi:hypothetical protein
VDTKTLLDHQFVTAAYAVTWIIQLGYLAFLANKWRVEKRKSRSAQADRR